MLSRITFECSISQLASYCECQCKSYREKHANAQYRESHCELLCDSHCFGSLLRITSHHESCCKSHHIVNYIANCIANHMINHITFWFKSLVTLWIESDASTRYRKLHRIAYRIAHRIVLLVLLRIAIHIANLIPKTIFLFSNLN